MTSVTSQAKVDTAERKRGYRNYQCIHCGDVGYLHHSKSMNDDFCNCFCGNMVNEEIPGFRD